MTESVQKKEEQMVPWQRVVVNVVNGEPLFIPVLPSYPSTWGKEGVGGFKARLPENLPPNTFVFFITRQRGEGSDETARSDDKNLRPTNDPDFPFLYYGFQVTKDGDVFIATQISFLLSRFLPTESYEKMVQGLYESNKATCARIITPDDIRRNDYVNNFVNPFQILSGPHPQITILILTPCEQERIKETLVSNITE